ncbi:hypothetical protein HCN44_009559 [Aphidius gifuensis]|uniref:F-box/LRR-repeat protein 15-like leucin rich repeat domain-containing protein n=1 Tax=Aphidius gifuensis TaxID=684658 RepID=A0A834Y7X0_APHGI|nr:hypothetical protein HCN44_009559 [Aphidius gifuensis]
MKNYCPFILDIKFTIKKTNNTELRQAIESINSLKIFNINDDSIDDEITADSNDNFWEPILLEIPKAVEGLDLYSDDNPTPRIEDFSILKRFYNLCQLSLHKEILDSNTIKIIADKKSLINLELIDCIFLGNTVFLSNLTNLKQLTLINAENFDDDTIIDITNKCHYIQYLDLSMCNDFNNSTLRQLSNLDKLQVLNLSGTINVDDRIFYHMYHLRILDCWGCQDVTDVGIGIVLDQCVNIEKLYISKTGITHESIINAAKVSRDRKKNIVLKIYICDSVIIGNFKKSEFYKNDDYDYENELSKLKIY